MGQDDRTPQPAVLQMPVSFKWVSTSLLTAVLALLTWIGTSFSTALEDGEAERRANREAIAMLTQNQSGIIATQARIMDTLENFQSHEDLVGHPVMDQRVRTLERVTERHDASIADMRDAIVRIELLASDNRTGPDR